MHFSSVLSKMVVEFKPDLTFSLPDPINITHHKTCGHDGIPANNLWKFTNEMVFVLFQLYNKCLFTRAKSMISMVEHFI